MGLNKYRYVEYADDGCDVYECMSCKDRWEVRSFPTVYCGNCGVKFEGKHECRSHVEPRWEYERFTKHQKYYDSPLRYGSDEREAYEAARAKEKVWVIQKRTIQLESSYKWDYESDAEPFPRVGEWEGEYQSDRPAWLHPARDIHAELVRHRKYDNDIAWGDAYEDRDRQKRYLEYSEGKIAGKDYDEADIRVDVRKIEYRAVTTTRSKAHGSVIYYRER